MIILKKLLQRMLNDDINFRPTSSQCYDELQHIKIIIKNPHDEEAKTYLENKNDPKKELKNVSKLLFLRQKIKIHYNILIALIFQILAHLVYIKAQVCMDMVIVSAPK